MTYSEFMEILRGVGLPGIISRLVCAVLCGGLIGIERETKRRSAGFRTHTLICIGASLTTLISKYMVEYMELPTDPARLGARVIAGMSFIGAGAIIVTSRRQVKGLTTAAGLWTAAIIGLAIGVGYYEVALIAVALVLIAEIFLSKLEYAIISNARLMNVHIEFREAAEINTIVGVLISKNIEVTDIEYTRAASANGAVPNAILSLRFRKKTAHENVLQILNELPEIISVEEL